jgi:SAM-dependent methyltransferase
VTGPALIELYRWQRGLDISAEITVPELSLRHDAEIDFYFFDPPCAGSAAFYRDLTSAPLYATEKQEYAFAAANLEKGDRVLDVGCGWGHFAAHARDVTYKGIELSESAAQFCQARGLDVERKFAAQIAEEHPDGFDAVTSFQVLEHVEDPAQFFADCVRNVRPGGKLIISVPNADSFMSVRENNYLNYPPHHVTWWTRKSLQYLFDRHGIELLGVHADRAEGNELSMHYGARLHSILQPERKGVRNSRMDRALLKLCDGIGKVVRKLPTGGASVPNGHSITMVGRKA